MKQLLQCNSSHYILYKGQVCVLKQFCNKLQKHCLIIIYDDKRKTVAIIHSDKYHQTFDTFLIQNQLYILSQDPTNICHNQNQQTLQQNNIQIDKPGTTNQPHPTTTQSTT